MANVLRLARVVLATILLAICSPAELLAEDRPVLPVAPTSSGEPAEYAINGHRIQLLEENGACLVRHRRAGGMPATLKLDLEPPCYLLTWRRQPPRRAAAEGLSDGVAVGAVGDIMAWRYPGAKGVTAIAVIGDPVPDGMRGDLFMRRQREGLRCVASVQGVRILGETVRLAKKRQRVGVLCAELGLEEKAFWMIAHD